MTGIKSGNTNYSFVYDAFGNKTQSKVGTQTLSTSTVGPKNGALQKITYGTGQYVGFKYDSFNNLSSQSYNGDTAFKWQRNSANVPTRMEDLINQVRYDYEYDVTGRQVRCNAVSTVNKNNLFSLEYGYDNNNNVSRIVNITSDKTARNSYVYGKDNLPQTYTIDDSRDVTYTYDTLNRLTKTSIATTKPLNMEYSYYLSERNASGSSKYKTTKISEETIAGQKYAYSYDEQGNITEIKKMVGGAYKLIHYYEYDQLGQLTYDIDYENNILKQYSYDTAGNILLEITSVMSGGRPVSSTKKTYGYTDTNWQDKLTSYDGKTITYDAIGNPLTYRDGMTMTWKNGKQLSTLQKGTTALSYTYDASDTRATKTVNGEKYTYQYLNGKLIHETRGDKSFNYYYDATGNLTAIKYRLTPTGGEYSYYVTHNWRGDIVGIYSGSGVLTAQYEYDSWGNVLSVKNSSGAVITDPNNVGLLNPFRYRGYYYDTESQFYYLVSRYYDPVTHRFINADNISENNANILWSNVYAYCLNNPINMIDPKGDLPYYIDPIQALDMWFKFQQRISYSIGSFLIGAMGELYVTDVLFRFALWGNGGELNNEAKDIIRNALKNSSEFKRAVKESLESTNNTYVWLTKGSTGLTESFDLYMGIHNLNFCVGGVKRNGVWFVTVKAWDTFDFTEWWNPFDGSHNPLGAIANDFGHYLQNNFTITPFYWEVVFDVMLF